MSLEKILGWLMISALSIGVASFCLYVAYSALKMILMNN
jgi:hypothetical protein